jgi:hypothetical protein
VRVRANGPGAGRFGTMLSVGADDDHHLLRGIGLGN